MRIDAAALGAEGLRYASRGADGAEREVVLGPSTGVTGFYESAPEGYVVDARALQLDVRRASWRVAGGDLIAERAALRQVALRLDIPAGDDPTRVRLGAETVEVAALDYAAEGLRFSGALTLEGLLVERDAAGKLSVVAVDATLRDLKVHAGELELHARQLRARRVVLVVQGDDLRVAIEGFDVDAIEVRAGHLGLRVAHVDAAGGVAWQNGSFTAGSLSAEGIDVVVDLPAPDPAATPPDATALASPPPRRLPDVPALDQLDGHVAADIHVEATLPILRERGATHALRVPIRGGAISFGQLEDGFSAVVDALLDFEVEGDELRLELDVIPIVKFDNVTLLSWRLVDDLDRRLAESKSIRLRRLLRFERPVKADAPADAPKAEKSSVRLLGVDVEGIAIDLAARAPMSIAALGGVVRLDGGEGRAIDALTVRGGVHLAFEGPSAPGRLEASARGIAGTLTGLTLGAFELVSARFAVEAVEDVVVALDGVRPTRVTAKVTSVRASGADLRRARGGT